MQGRSPIADRKLIQWVAAYVAVAWAVLQGVDLLGGMWSWSAGVFPALIGPEALGRERAQGVMRLVAERR
jgi:hypothetical protein